MIQISGLRHLTGAAHNSFQLSNVKQKKGFCSKPFFFSCILCNITKVKTLSMSPFFIYTGQHHKLAPLCRFRLTSAQTVLNTTVLASNVTFYKPHFLIIEITSFTFPVMQQMISYSARRVRSSQTMSLEFVDFFFRLAADCCWPLSNVTVVGFTQTMTIPVHIHLANSLRQYINLVMLTPLLPSQRWPPLNLYNIITAV